VSRAGANAFVAGSAIFGSKDYAASIRAMRAALKAYEPEPVDMSAT
jgi:ribulose-phosphate 3-epimerase